ncbi:MAG: thiamine phosphate synthase [Proteobacteria bacterium]|nr:thiamine phosphate synthase [Pseudomonadota bacterium]
MTDPVRTPDPAGVATGLPRGAAVILRTFGAPDALATALKLRDLTRRRGLLLLIGADEALAARVRADGLHMPERRVRELPRIRARHPRWIFTAAAHSPRAVRRAEKAGADAILLSAVFPSRSASARTPLGPVRFARMVRATKAPVLALGGVNTHTAGRLLRTGAAGLAAVDAWLD